MYENPNDSNYNYPHSWEGSGWTRPETTKLMTDKGLKLAYRKALTLFHPDKVLVRHLES